jgi:hypothetical protein
VEEKESLYIIAGNVVWYIYYVKWQEVSSKKLKSELSYDPAIPFLGVYPKEMRSAFRRYLHTHVYCSIIHNSKDRESGWVPVWIKELWCIYIMEYYSAIKKSEILPFARKWMETGDIC